MNTTKYQKMFSATVLSLILAFAAFGQAQTEIQTLTLNQPLERQIKGGETHSFGFSLKAGEYARAEDELKDIAKVYFINRLITDYKKADGENEKTKE